MSYLVRFQNQFSAKLCNHWRGAITAQKFNYSQKAAPTETVKVSRKKTYLYTAFISIAGLAFAYYVKKEKDYGNF